MSIQTKAQQDMKLAAELVQKVAGETQEVKSIYGGLCHSFPVLVRTCGLCQVIAFHREKAGEGSNSREKAHQLLLQHVSKVIGLSDGHPNTLLDKVKQADAVTYMLMTRRVLTAWVYFKRFAGAILGVESAESAKEGT